MLLAHFAGNLSATPQDLPSESKRVRKHFVIVERTERFLRHHLRSDIYVWDMCLAAGVSERSQRYEPGISPNRYLCMLRLCAARGNLASSGANRDP